MREAAVELVEQFGVAMGHEVDGTEQQMLDRHLAAASLGDAARVGVGVEGGLRHERLTAEDEPGSMRGPRAMVAPNVTHT